MPIGAENGVFRLLPPHNGTKWGGEMKRILSFLLAVMLVFSVAVMTDNFGAPKAGAASWNGTNYGGGGVYGYRSFLEAFGIKYDVYMKWLDDHDADSPNPNYYLGTPYVGDDHRNPHGDCKGAYGYYDTPGKEGMNCTGFVWHVLYKSAVMSGASWWQIDRLEVMWRVPVSWAELGVYRIYFDSIEEAYNSGVLEKGDLMWIYGSEDCHNTIFYGDSPEDFIYWDSAGKCNRYSKVHAIGKCLGLWVAKASQPNVTELKIDTADSGEKAFGANYYVFDSRSAAQNALDHPGSSSAWNEKIGSIVLDNSGHGCLRTGAVPNGSQLWANGTPSKNLSYFSTAAKRVSLKNTYYAVQYSPARGAERDTNLYQFKDYGKRTETGYRIRQVKIAEHLPSPAITSFKSTGTGVKISWDAVPGAKYYQVCYKHSDGSWRSMKTTSSTSYLDDDVRVGKTYTYNVRCVDAEGSYAGNMDPAGWKYTYQPLPTPELVSHETTDEGVLLKWNPVKGAATYRVYYKNSKDEWKRFAETTETQVVDTDFKQGDTYTYTIRCADSDGDFASDYNRKGWEHTILCDTPVITSAVSTASGVEVSYEPVKGAYRYRVYYLSRKDNSWKSMGETDKTSFTDTVVKSGTTYTYAVQTVDKKNRLTSELSDSFDGTFISVPKVGDIHTADGGVSLSWKAVDGAQGYRVMRSSGDEWETVGLTAETSFLDTSAESGVSYSYTVACTDADGADISAYNEKGFGCTYVAAPMIDRIYSDNSGVVLRWEPVAGAYQYRVFYKGKNGWTRLGVTTKTSFTDTDVGEGKTYLYTVRCMNKNGDYISDYHREGFYGTYRGKVPFTAESAAEGVRLTWEPIEGVAAYRVFYKGRDGWERLAKVEGNSFTDTALKDGGSRVYTVRGMDENDSYITGYLKEGQRVTYTAPVIPVGEDAAPLPTDTAE